MKTLGTFTSISAGVWLATLGLSVQAGTLINNFTTPFDYVANGIIGDTNWDGMYLRFGDIPGGNVGDDPAGDTVIANSGITYPGYLALRSSGGDWSGAGDDGVLLWKLVTGDFDVSVQSSPFDLNGGTAFDNGGYQMAGLMARAYNPDNSGSPYSTTSTNLAENYVMLLRFQEYGLNEVNEATNSVRVEHIFPESDADTGATRYFRMVRSSLTNFTFYWKTNGSDSWVQILNNLPAGGVLVRSDLTGPLQVGIAQSPFSTVTHDAVFTDFELSGTNVIFPTTMPAAPSALVTTATNTAGALTFSWTLGTAGDRSLVVMSRRPIQYNPVQGITYTANSAFGTAGTLLGGAGEYVVYNGAGTSVTVTNLGANILTYYVAVYEYGAAAPPVYNTAAPATPATGAVAGPGIVTGATLSAFASNIPVNGAAPLLLTASYSTGDTGDQSANATWLSSDTTIASVNAAGVVTGVTNGTATITGTFAGFSPTTNITVRTPIFTDNFSVAQDYVANGLQGTPYDQLFLKFGDVPGGNALGATAGDVEGKTTILNANVSSNNTLYLSSSGGTWEATGNDGPFLAKVVTGDFEASIHITQMDALNFNCAGLMARLFGTGGAAGASGETHVNLWRVQNGAPQARLTVDDALVTTLPGLAAADRWMLMARVNSTNFYFFESSDPTTAGWAFVPGSPLVVAEAAGNAPMEVGVAQQMQNAAAGIDLYDSLMIDGPGIVSPSGTPTPPAASGLTATLNSDLTMTFSWVATNSAGAPVASILVMRADGPITAQPTYGLAPGYGGAFGTGLSLGDGNYVVARSSSSPTTVTVTGLTPGVAYYAAVYTFAGTYPDRVYNSVLPATGVTANLVDGVLESLTVTPPPTVPLGGLVIPEVIGHYTGGGVKNVSAFADLTSANTNVAAIGVGSGAVSGMGLGSTTVQVVYAGLTNNIAITVRPPSFTDEFNVAHDYVANGTAGSPWDGIYLNQGDIPETGYAGTGSTSAAIASGGVLSVTNQLGGWAGDQNDGFFLFKYVPGDFQVAVHCPDFQIVTYQEVGLLARGYSFGTNGTDKGAPFGRGLAATNSAEYWMGFTKFDEYNIGTYARRNLNNVEEQFTQPPTGSGGSGTLSPDNWLLIIRQGTVFTFFQRDTSTEPWRLTPGKVTLSAPVFAGMPMQVGIQQTPYTATDLYGTYEHFMLDATTGSPLAIAQAGGNVTISWPLIAGTLQYSLGVSPASWLPVTGVTPVLSNGRYVVTLPVTAAPRYFRLVQ